jgi:hypothetical protein
VVHVLAQGEAEDRRSGGSEIKKHERTESVGGPQPRAGPFLPPSRNTRLVRDTSLSTWVLSPGGVLAPKTLQSAHE